MFERYTEPADISETQIPVLFNNYNKKNCLKLDWLSFTFHSSEGVKGEKVFLEFVHTFPELDELWSVQATNGARYYQCMVTIHDNICLKYNLYDTPHTVRMGVNVTIPSHGLQWFYEKMGCDTVYDLFTTLHDRHCTMSRIDVCYDDYSMTYMPEWYCRKYIENLPDHRTMSTNMMGNKECDSRSFDTFTQAQFIKSGTMKKPAWTFYLGDRKNKLLRIYNKEIESKGEIKAVRYEAEYHCDRANRLVDFILSMQRMPSFTEWIIGFLRILDDTKQDTNISRMPTLPEWEEWLNSIKAEAEEEETEKTTLTNSIDWSSIPIYTAAHRKECLSASLGRYSGFIQRMEYQLGEKLAHRILHDNIADVSNLRSFDDTIVFDLRSEDVRIS